jgi:AcrR family transcriptional regulator
MTAVTTPRERRSVRERLLAAADALFYEHGINAVGIDRVIEQAGVAKASLYDTFGSKEALIRAYLESRGAQRRARLEARMALCDSPTDRMLSVFALLTESAALPGYQGCAFVRARAEVYRSAGIREACDASRGWLRQQFTALARAAGARDPEGLAQQLSLLYDGATVGAHVDDDAAAPAAAHAMARQLIAAALPRAAA